MVRSRKVSGFVSAHYGIELCLCWVFLVTSGCQSGWGGLWESSVEDPVVASLGESQPKKVFNCASTEEFLTTITYLRQRKTLGLADQDMRSVATTVAGGCHGAAGRFITVMELLLKAGVDGRSALLMGEEYSHEDSAKTEAFKGIFRHSFVPSGLDLEPSASIDLAQRLLKSVRLPPQTLVEEFQELVSFCVRHKGLDLSRPQCANLVTTLLVNTPQLELTDTPGISESFIESLTFLTDRDGPNLTTRDALAVAQQLAAISPYAPGNFTQAYGFAVAPKGLRLDRSQGVRFALELAEKTVGHMTGFLEN